MHGETMAIVWLVALGLLVALAPGPAGAALSRLHTDGTKWVDAAGRPVLPKGCNLGNWLVQEMWMHTMKAEGIPDQYTLEKVLAKRFGPARKEALLEAYHANFVTARDFHLIKSFGMNVVRVPFVYWLLEDDAHPYHLRPNAWRHLDRALQLAEAEGLYVILDLHGAPGGQNWWHHSGREARNRLWGSEEFRRRTVWLWKQLATRYRNRDVVAGYGLLNEPYSATPEQLKPLMLRIYQAIREVDPDHIIIFAGLPGQFEFYGNAAEQHLTNVAVDMHFYPGLFGWGDFTAATHEKWLAEVPSWQKRQESIGMPVLVGEMNVVGKQAGGAEMMRRSFDAYTKLGWAVTMWSYKVFTAEGGTANGSWGMVTNPPAKVTKVDINTSSYEDILRYFQSLSTEPYEVYEELRQALTR